MRTALVLCADTHINSTVAVCPPVVKLDEGSYHASKGQRWLWECWKDAWDQVATLTLSFDETIGIFCGDMGDLDAKRRSNQIISPSKAVILRMCADVLEPTLPLLTRYYVIRGTMAHEGKSSWLEEAIAKDISATGGEAEGRYSWWHLRGIIAGLKVDIAHHVSMGGMPWTERNAANKLAAVIQWKYAIEKGQPLPDLAVRAHNHKYSDSGGNFKTHAMTLPCWSLITEYAYRLGRENDTPDIGMVVLLIENGKYEKHRIAYRPESDKRIWTRKL